MKTLIILKRIIPFVLLFAITLAISKCSTLSNSTSVYYIYLDFNSSAPEAVLSILFLSWPFIFLILSVFVKSLGGAIGFRGFEAMLCALGLLYLFFITIWQTMLYGGYIVAFSFILYFMVTIFEIDHLLEKRRGLEKLEQAEDSG